MAKTITDQALFPSDSLNPANDLFPKDASFFENSQILHLFEFEFKSLDGLTTEIVRFTDNELFIIIDGETYTPTSISFDEIREDFTLQADQVNIVIDNISQEITADALTKEWRNNNGKVYRVVYNELPQSTPAEIEAGVTPATDLFPSETLFPANLEASFENGIFSFDEGYPSINFDKSEYLNRFNKDLVFDGLQDDFSGGNGTATIVLTSVLSVWDTPYPADTYDQGEYLDMISAMTTTLEWKA
jgi:hypothetical protein